MKLKQLPFEVGKNVSFKKRKDTKETNGSRVLCFDYFPLPHWHSSKDVCIVRAGLPGGGGAHLSSGLYASSLQMSSTHSGAACGISFSIPDPSLGGKSRSMWWLLHTPPRGLETERNRGPEPWGPMGPRRGAGIEPMHSTGLIRERGRRVFIFLHPSVLARAHSASCIHMEHWDVSRSAPRSRRLLLSRTRSGLRESSTKFLRHRGGAYPSFFILSSSSGGGVPTMLWIFCTWSSSFVPARTTQPAASRSAARDKRRKRGGEPGVEERIGRTARSGQIGRTAA
jgi:hypothetical protein